MSTVVFPDTLPGAQYSSWLNTVTLIEQSISEQAGRKMNCARGVGGIKHQQIQLIIANLAVEHGYQGNIEHGIEGTHQRVDVGIIGHGMRIACEVPVSTVYSEYSNIRKCLDAGFDHVLSVALERKVLEIVKNGLAQRLSSEERKKVFFCFPEHIPFLLRGFTRDIPDLSQDVKIIRGWRVTTTYRNPGPEKIAEIRNALAKIMAQSILRQKA